MNEKAARILSGDPRALARAATEIENGDASILAELPERPGLVVGITGAPGAGKSTLIDGLARVWRAAGLTVAVIAVDPSSELTGGAILGDRIRMQAHHRDPGVFIRSMATRGVHGGLARTTAEMAELFRRAGRDVVIVETVGVGQSEIDVARLAGVTAVVVVPGMGDGIQAMKAGILEIASLFVINKADHPGVEQTEAELREFFPAPVVKTVASEGKGLEELAAAIEERAH